MRSGGRPVSRRRGSARPRSGWSGTASFGSTASIASMRICAKCRGRTERVAKGTSSPVRAPADRTLTVTRVFDAPRELVYRAWTDPKEFGKWFPPLGFSAARCELDVRPGGTLRIDMKGGDDAGEFAGVVFPGKGVYREVLPNERLSFTFEGEDGAAPPQIVMTVVFEDE